MKTLITLLLWSSVSFAHPVIYQDGTAISSMTMPHVTDAQFGYSFSSKWSVGANYWRLENQNDEKEEFHLAKVNHLLWRHNARDSQANLYVHGGFGDGWMSGVEADWESREYFTSFKVLHLGRQEFDNTITVARFGHSPFLASFSDLQVWGMVQLWHDPFTAATVKVTPLLRFMYNNVLWEFGSSLNGEMMLNLMVHL